jgi:hypothetical protein
MSRPAVAATPIDLTREVHPIERVSRDRWEKAIERLRNGHMYRGQGSGPATTTPEGCIMPHKQGNRALNAYIQIDPAPKWLPAHQGDKQISWQLAHRVACYLEKPAGEVQLMLYGGYHASHLCHRSECNNTAHMVIETKQANEARKACSGRLDIHTTVNNVRYLLPATPCPHQPACIAIQQQRIAQQVP